MPRQRATQEVDDTPLTAEDELTILIATDNHVGYAERDSVRGDDSWKTFQEIMEVAKSRDVDMVLLAGDLFHDNKPSRKSMFYVMKSLRQNCLGDKPCALEMLSDASENFGGTFDHVNYEDEDINVAIPVFSIHGNHDDPTEEGNFAALDLLQMSGLVNYFGKTPQADNITIKPVCLQKGRTKLALYGMSNVRDERLFRSFRDGKVKFYQPGTQKNEWFNLMAVHQNHHAHTNTGYLPENFLPSFVDLVVWGHEHECLIEPRYNPEMNFHVMQPGSSVATSLMPGEAVTKKVAILKVTGREFKVEPIRLKTVRPFIMREIVLAEERALKNIWKKDNNRTAITQHLMSIVEEMIEEARVEYIEAQEEPDPDMEVPLPLVRLRVEFTAPEGGRFDVENAQRFSNRFNQRVANTSDVVQFHRRKTTARRKEKNDPDAPDVGRMDELEANRQVPVERLIREFVKAQNLSILPHNQFDDAVSQFVDKNDNHRVMSFVTESLISQVNEMMKDQAEEDEDDNDINEKAEKYRQKMEEAFAKGERKNKTTRKVKPKPDNWDTDMDGEWEDNPASVYEEENGMDVDEDDDDAASVAASTTSRNGTHGRGAARGRGRGARGAAAASTRTTKAAAPKKAATTTARGRKKVVEEPSDDDEEESDSQMILDDDDDESEEDMFVKQAPKKKAAPAPKAAPAKKAPAKKAAPSTQSKLNFSQPAARATNGTSRSAAEPRAAAVVISDDDISDDDAFEPTPAASRRR